MGSIEVFVRSRRNVQFSVFIVLRVQFLGVVFGYIFVKVEGFRVQRMIILFRWLYLNWGLSFDQVGGGRLYIVRYGLYCLVLKVGEGYIKGSMKFIFDYENIEVTILGNFCVFSLIQVVRSLGFFYFSDEGLLRFGNFSQRYFLRVGRFR